MHGSGVTLGGQVPVPGGGGEGQQARAQGREARRRQRRHLAGTVGGGEAQLGAPPGKLLLRAFAAALGPRGIKQLDKES